MENGIRCHVAELVETRRDNFGDAQSKADLPKSQREQQRNRVCGPWTKRDAGSNPAVTTELNKP